MPFPGARRKLDEARRLADGLRTARDAPEFRITVLGIPVGIGGHFRRSSKGRRQAAGIQKVHDAKRSEIRSDPLLLFVMDARDEDLHEGRHRALDVLAISAIIASDPSTWIGANSIILRDTVMAASDAELQELMNYISTNWGVEEGAGAGTLRFFRPGSGRNPADVIIWEPGNPQATDLTHRGNYLRISFGGSKAFRISFGGSVSAPWPRAEGGGNALTTGGSPEGNGAGPLRMAGGGDDEFDPEP